MNGGLFGFPSSDLLSKGRMCFVSSGFNPGNGEFGISDEHTVVIPKRPFLGKPYFCLRTYLTERARASFSVSARSLTHILEGSVLPPLPHETIIGILFSRQ